ncbi:MAG: YedE-related selenium metabolism membrane protein [Lentisphaerae bacterium]|nr:YedE-related selenium metabolism membrane protein [Lentisphaerota bacterium]
MVIGVVAAVLQKLGNPGNMGVCVACFERDIAGALGLHNAAGARYVRPEIIGLTLGATAAALIFREFRPRGGSAPIVRFALGAFAMIGALVFLGCPWRALLRLAGGDGNAVAGLLGLVSGIWVGTLFFRSGYNLGRGAPARAVAGWMFPALMAGLLTLRLVCPPVEGAERSAVLLYSLQGPGAMRAPAAVALGAGLLIGFLAQRTRFCTMGAFRDLLLFRQMHLLSGVIALVVAACLVNLVTGQFHPGFNNQPVAHSFALWNFAGMALAGLAFALAGGCPGRQLFMSGEGDGDAAVFVVGMIAGAAFAHNFGLASSPAGPGPHAAAGLSAGLLICLVIGLSMRQRRTG